MRLMDEASLKQDYERAASFRDRLTALSPHPVAPGHQSADASRRPTCSPPIRRRARPASRCSSSAAATIGATAPISRAPTRAVAVEEVLESFIAQFYDDKPPPKLILLSHDIAGAPAARRGAVAARRAQDRGDTAGARREARAGRACADQCARGAGAPAGRRRPRRRRSSRGSPSCSISTRRPSAIEVYDNSHISGTNPVGAMIVAGPEGFIKGQYRKFNMKSEDLAPGDDYAMMREMLTRRFSKLAKEKGEVERLGRARSRADRRRPGPARRGAMTCSTSSACRTTSRWRRSPRAPTATPAASASICAAGAVAAGAARSRAVLHPEASRRGASLCHRRASGQAQEGDHRLAARRGAGHRPDAQARPAQAFRLGQGGEPRRHRRSRSGRRHQRADGQDDL